MGFHILYHEEGQTYEVMAFVKNERGNPEYLFHEKEIPKRTLVRDMHDLEDLLRSFVEKVHG